jgi:O-antigen/teichoic acid export membrane protein
VSGKQSLAFGASLANTLIAGAVGVLLIPIYLRYLTTEEYGIWLMILSIMSYLGLANLGIGQTVSNYVAAKWNQARERDHLLELVSSGWAAYNAIAVAIVGIVALSYTLFVQAGHAMSFPFFVAAVGFACVLPWQIFSVSLRSTGRIFEEQGFAVGASLLKFLAVTTALAAGQKLIALAMIHTIALGAPRLAAKAYLGWRLPWFAITLRRASWPATKQIMRPSAAFFIIQISGVLAFSTDSLVIGTFLGSASVPSYAVPMQFMMLALGIVTLVSGISFPKISNLHANGEAGELKKFILSLASFQYIVGTIIVVLAWMFGQSFISYWASPALSPQGFVFMGMAAFFVMQIVVAPLDALVMATSSHRNFTYFAIAEGLLKVGLSVLLVTTYGIAGVIFATVITRLASVAALMIIGSKIIDFRVHKYLALIILFLLLPSAAAIGAGAGQSFELAKFLISPNLIAQILTLLVMVSFLAFLRVRLFKTAILN